MSCAPGEYFNGATGKCMPKATTSKSMESTGTFWGSLGSSLTGVSSVIAAVKGQPTQAQTYNYNTNPNGSNNTMLIVILAVVFLLIIVLMAARR